ncbi:MAG: hypothetical protein U0Q19_07075 [Kineosporiaceae bacterium]
MAKLLGELWRNIRIRAVSKELIAVLVVTIPAISYSLLYIAYFQFYSFFGLRPADVGLDRTRLLQESLLGPFVFPLGEMAVHLRQVLLALAALAVMSAIGGVGNGLRGASAVREAAAGAALGLAMIWLASTAYGYGFVLVEANRLGNEVFERGRVLPSLVLHDPSTGLNMPLIDIQALPARVVALDGGAIHMVTAPSAVATSPVTGSEGATAATAPAPSATPGATAEPEPTAPPQAPVPDQEFFPDCLIYLGRTEKTYVLFDVRYEKVVQVFSDSALLTVAPRAADYEGEHLPSRCTDNAGNITPN